MKGKVVFFDIDGTVWDWNWVIPESAKEAIRKLKENGHHPIICSGRSKSNIMNETLLSLGFEGIVCACGGYVECDGKVLYENYVDNSIVKEIVETANECRVPIVLEGPTHCWISEKGFEKDDFVTRMYEAMGDGAVTMKGYTPDIKANKFSGDITVASDYETFKSVISKYFQVIEHGITPDVNNKRNDKDFSIVKGVFEVVPPGISKAHGIKILCDYLGTTPKEAIAIGDSNNDLEMIECVGCGIAMGDGADTLKSIADYVTTGIWEDGIYNALSHFNLI